MSLKNNHALEFFYEKVKLIAHCDQMPNHMLVCYRAADEENMHLAMKNINRRYGEGIAVQENMPETPGFVGFWLPEVATPLYTNSGEPPEAQPTAEATFLSEKVKQQKIPAMHASSFTDLHRKLPEALLASALHTSKIQPFSVN